VSGSAKYEKSRSIFYSNFHGMIYSITFFLSCLIFLSRESIHLKVTISITKISSNEKILKIKCNKFLKNYIIGVILAHDTTNIKSYSNLWKWITEVFTISESKMSIFSFFFDFYKILKLQSIRWRRRIN